MAKLRSKCMSVKARRLRMLRTLKEKNERPDPIEPVDKTKRLRWKKIHVTKQFTTANDSTVERAILTTACILALSNETASHGKTCSGAAFDSMRIYNNKIQIDCVQCKQTFQISQDLGMEECPLQKALTLSVFASGAGLEVVNTVLSTLQIPELSFYKYQQSEEQIFGELNSAKTSEFRSNANEEHSLAMDLGEYIEVNGEKFPYITVVVDGGWSKRSYGHKYDSKSGVAVIIGARTKKVLWMDTRIKICMKCSRAQKENRPVKNHRCFKNWDGSAQAMEADIIVDGFRRSIPDHGLIYRYVVGDADSSVYFKIKSTIHYPGDVEIEKIDCVNHALRCLTTKLHGIAKTTTFGKQDRDHVAAKIAQIARDAKGAINYNFHNTVMPGPSLPPAKRLFNDLTNIPDHVFGNHSRCDSYFCKKVGAIEYDPIRETKIFSFVRTAVGQLAQRSGRLIHNVTSNLAEGFMSQICKFTSGKRCSQSQRYGYSMRAIAAVFAYDYGSFWPAAVYKRFHGISNIVWDQKLNQSVLYRQRAKKRGKTRFVKQRTSSTRKSNDYGEDSCDADIDANVLLASVDSLCSQLQVKKCERDRIQLCTIGQAFNDEWKFQRKSRITASFAGKIFRMKDSTNNSCCIKSILYPLDLSSNENVKRGIDMEPFAKRKYEESTGNFVTECGIFISLENGIFGASPDGLVGEDGIIEIKCPAVPPLELLTRVGKILVQEKGSSTILLNKRHILLPSNYAIVCHWKVFL